MFERGKGRFRPKELFDVCLAEVVAAVATALRPIWEAACVAHQEPS